MWVLVERDGEATFAINESTHPSRVESAIPGFLLIVRTGRIFTAHVVDPMSGL
jgi:hypothetical protein